MALRGKERICNYQAGISYLPNQGFTITAIDALSVIKKAFPEIPYQLLSASSTSANKTFAYH